jgi:hypothetical protein
MDRKLTRKEKTKAKTKRAVVLGVFLVSWLGIYIYGSNHVQISEGIENLRVAISEILHIVALMIESL